MAARLWYAAIALVLLTASCATPAPQVKRIALFGPFESTYREAGYDALYPIKLALTDEALADIQLLSVDDGGSRDNAIVRAHALAADPSVYLALVAGPIAAEQAVMDAFEDVPVVVIGDWSATAGDGVFILASEAITTQITAQVSGIYEAAGLNEATGGEIFGLKSFAAIAQDPSDIIVLTSAAPPSPAFRERLLASDLFVPEPGLLATIAYDTGTMAARVVAQATSRTDVLTALPDIRVEGLNGIIRFNTKSYWSDAPLYKYRYTGGVLRLTEP